MCRLRQVLAHVGAGGPGVPAGAVRALRRVLADRVLARAAADAGAARRRAARAALAATARHRHTAACSIMANRELVVLNSNSWAIPEPFDIDGYN